LLLFVLLVLCSLYIMCFCTKVRLEQVSRISIVLFCVCVMKSIYFKPCNIILSHCKDNTKGYLGSHSIECTPIRKILQNKIYYTYIHIYLYIGAQNIWWLIQDDRILIYSSYPDGWILSYLHYTATGIFF